MSKTNKNHLFPEITCERCGFRWNNRVKKPVQCPNCKSRLYSKPKDK